MYSADLRLRGLVVDGVPVVCPGCGSGAQLTLDRRGPRETWPAWLGCEQCGHGEDHSTITNGLLDAAVEACGPAGPEPEAFVAAWREHTIEGERAPEFGVADLVTAAQVWADVGRTEARKRWGKAKRRARGRLLGIRRKAGDQAGQLIGSAKAAALTAAWELQTGGAGPVRPPRRRCRVKGCRGGWVTMRSRIHGSSGRPQDIKVPCAACQRAA